MKLVAHQQVEGVEPGETFTVDAERGQWLLDNGYAGRADGDHEPESESESAPAKKASRSKKASDDG